MPPVGSEAQPGAEGAPLAASTEDKTGATLQQAMISAFSPSKSLDMRTEADSARKWSLNYGILCWNQGTRHPAASSNKGRGTARPGRTLPILDLLRVRAHTNVV